MRERAVLCRARSPGTHPCGWAATRSLPPRPASRAWMGSRAPDAAGRSPRAHSHDPDVFANITSSEVLSGAPVALDTAATADDVVTLRPIADLAPGEYLVFRFDSAQPWLIEGYTFEVEST